MKSYLGFSRKEARGFVLLIPVLLILGFTPSFVAILKKRSANEALLAYQVRLDSLETLQVQLVASPLPTFNPQDTLRTSRNQHQLENINRIRFSEADSITLQIVPGIGQATAGRIIKYRDNLGGFHHRGQVLEVFGVKPETAEALWEFFEFDERIFKTIPINTATLEDLAKHPYISYGEAKVLIAYRAQHGKFEKAEDLLQIKIFKAEWVAKIRPYLNFD